MTGILLTGPFILTRTIVQEWQSVDPGQSIQLILGLHCLLRPIQILH